MIAVYFQLGLEGAVGAGVTSFILSIPQRSFQGNQEPDRCHMALGLETKPKVPEHLLLRPGK